jgi:mannose/fructose/N-acetylgalactosamine-specific phosphotransferase system component IIB
LQDLMDIALVRVDNRLVHGQILEAWVPFLRASCIVVADDQVASDFFQETVIRMAVPREIQVIISGLKEFAETYSFIQGQGKKTIVLFSTVSAALVVHRLGFRFTKLNIGNVYNESCRIPCTPSVLLSDTDIIDITHLHDEGVQVEVRRVPKEKPMNFHDIVHGLKS